jgi:hypothetical protein
MNVQSGIAEAAPRSRASFLDGGITARYLPSAEVAPFAVRGVTPVRASGTQGVDCSINPHIPACNPTRDCTLEPCTQDPSLGFC